MHRSGIALVVAGSLLAGCLSASQPLTRTGALDTLSQPVYDLAKMVKAPLKTFAPDGKLLDTFAYLPPVAGGTRVPALVFFSPYYSNGVSESRTDNQDEQKAGFHTEVIHYFVPRGYAVVHSAVRGTGFSEGCFTIGGPTERADIDAVLNEVAKQPWSDGSVAVLGKSYVGTTANEALLTGNPHVKTVVPISAISDFYKYNFYEGVPINPQGYTFNYYYEKDVAIVPPYDSPDAETVHLAAEEAQCTHAETQSGGFASAVTGDKSDYWQARDYNLLVDKATAPVFLVHGLQDWNVQPDMLDPWLGLLQNRSAPTKVWLGQWFHDYPNHNHFNANWSRGDWNATLLRWFDWTLKGVDTGVAAEPSVDVQDDQGVWRHEDRWPPPRAVTQRFFLGPGTLGAEPGTGTASWQDTSQPLPNPPKPGEAPYALFATEALAKDLHVSGTAHLRLALTHSAPWGAVAATLWDLAPNGTAHRINYGFFDYKHRDGLAEAAPVTPHSPFRLDVPFYPQDDVVLAGHRLLLTLAGNDSPTCWYTTVDEPGLPSKVPQPPLPPEADLVLGTASFACAPASGYDDPGPLTQPVPSGGTSTLALGQDTVLELPTLGPVRGAFDPPHEAWKP